MAKMRGIDFIIKIKTGEEEKAIAGQRSCTLNRSADTTDVTSKDSMGWQESMSGLKNWGIDTDGLIVADDESFEMLETAFMEGKEIDIVISSPMKKKYTGKAIITDFPIEAPYDDAATYSISLTGTGALASTSTVEVQSAEKLLEEIPVVAETKARAVTNKEGKENVK